MSEQHHPRQHKEAIVHDIQEALHHIVEQASPERLRVALQGFIASHNHLTCMYCSIAPHDCDVFGLLREELTSPETIIPPILQHMNSVRWCKHCRQHLESIDGIFCTDCENTYET